MMMVSDSQFVLDEVQPYTLQSASIGDHSLISPEPGTLTAYLSRIAETGS